MIKFNKTTINHTTAKNIKATIVENLRYYQNPPETGEEILAIQKYHLFRKFQKKGKEIVF